MGTDIVQEEANLSHFDAQNRKKGRCDDKVRLIQPREVLVGWLKKDGGMG